jgi:uncharacterized LabA/DUF88 family protein
MSPKERVKIFLDGSNFYYYCKDIGIPAYPKFDLEKLIDILVENRLLQGKAYYIGAVRGKPSDSKSMKMMAKQMSFFSYLKKNEWKINKGYLLKTGGKHHEKGVDVKLALDLALGAVDDLYDIAILISSDTDILPAVEEAKSRGKKVEYVGFSDNPSKAMLNKCNSSFLLGKKILKGCLI